MRRLLRACALALAVSVVLVAAYGAPASARRRRHRPPPPPPRNQVQISNQASLSSDHQTADLVLTVTCRSDLAPAPIRVSLRQGGVGGSASSGTNYKCTGGAQRVVVPVSSGGGSFHKGGASASASVTWHGSSTNSTSDSSTNAFVELV
jgi:uncharacterized membrane protein YgcG